MDQIKEIPLLPINSYELEAHLTQVGLSVLKAGKEYHFSRKSTGVEDCDFLQSVIIEFTAEIKTDFIAYYGIDQASLKAGTSVRIQTEELPQDVAYDAAFHAKERNLNVVDPKLTFSFRTTRFIQTMLQVGKTFLYNQRASYRNRKIRPARFPVPSPGKFRLLMSTYHRNTIFTLTPVQDRLKDRQDVSQLYIANRYETYCRLLQLGYPGIINGWSIRTDVKIVLKEAVLQDFLNEYFRTYFPYGQATDFFKKRFYEKLKQKLLFVTALYSPMQRVLDKYQPHVLLISSCSTADAQVLIHLCAARNVRVIEMTHGMFQDTPLLEFQNVPVKLVWCERQRDLMKKYRPDVECHVIGNPKHDELLEKFRNEPPPRTIDKPYVLFASTPGNNISISWVTYVKILKEFIEVAKACPDLFFIVKLHPSEDLDKVQQVAKVAEAPGNFGVAQSQNVYELLFHAEIVMVLTSTVGFEALLWNKKLICYTIPNSDKWLPFTEYNLAMSAANKEELLACIRFFLVHESLTLNNPNREYFAFSDGTAIDKMLSLTLTGHTG